MNSAEIRADGWQRDVAGLHRQVAEMRHRSEAAGAVLAELRGLHKPWRVYDECDHTHPDGDPALVDCTDFATCEDGYLYSVCTACCTDVNGQTEACASGHDHGEGLAICPTAAILDGGAP